MNNNFFKSAFPVWIDGRDKEWNISTKIICRAKSLSGAQLTITGAAFYQVFANGNLIHFGPAKKAAGYIGVDVLNLSDIDLREISIIVSGYYCKCYNGVLIPSFIQAEIEKDDSIIAATGHCGFEYFEYHARMQKTMRYSVQRQFSECYDLGRADKVAYFVITDPQLKYLPRGIDLLDLDKKCAKFLKVGTYTLGEKLKQPLRNFQSVPKNSYVSQFQCEELESTPFIEYLKMIPDYGKLVTKGSSGTVEHWDFGKIETGFITLKIKAKCESRIILAFAEQNSPDGRPNVTPAEATNCIEWRLPAGEYDLISFEPYTVMGVEIMVTQGDVDINHVGITECAYSARKIIPYKVNDPELALVYQAAVDSFRHNAVDVFMDCPSRERAGWLCDSYYTSQTEFNLTGKTQVEDEFLNNYLLGRWRTRRSLGNDRNVLPRNLHHSYSSMVSLVCA